MRLISKAKLLEMVPYTIQHIYRLEKAGKFPKRVRVGEQRVAWVHAEVADWIEHRVGARQQTSGEDTSTQSTEPVPRTGRATSAHTEQSKHYRQRSNR